MRRPAEPGFASGGFRIPDSARSLLSYQGIEVLESRVRPQETQTDVHGAVAR